MQIKKILAMLLALALAVTSLTCLTALAEPAAEDDILLNFNFDSNSLTDATGNATLSINNTARAKVEDEKFYSIYGKGGNSGFITTPTAAFKALDYNPLALAGNAVTISMDVTVDNFATHKAANQVYSATLFAYTGTTSNKNSMMFLRFNSAGNLVLNSGGGSSINMGDPVLTATDDTQELHIELQQVTSPNGNTVTNLYVNDALISSQADMASFGSLAAKTVDENGVYIIGGTLYDDSWFLDGTIDNVIIKKGAADIPYDADAVTAAEDAVRAIGTVEHTDACKEKIDAARQAYNVLDAAGKYYFSSELLAVLEQAEKDYNIIDGKVMEFTFDDNSLADTYGRVNLALRETTHTQVVDEKLTVDSIVTYATNSWDSISGFKQATYDPISLTGKTFTFSTDLILEENTAFNTNLFAYHGGWDGSKARSMAGIRFDSSGHLVVRVELNGVQGTNLQTSVCYANTSSGEDSIVGKTTPTNFAVTQREQEDHSILTQILVDGEVVASSTAVPSFYDAVALGAPYTDSDYAFGSSNWGGGHSIHGSMDNITIYNYDITDVPAEPIAYDCISAGAALSEGADQYDITWNMELLDQLADDQFVTFNEAYAVVDYGVIVTAAEDAMDAYGKLLAESEDTAAKVDGQAYKTSFGQTAYSHFAYRRTGVKAGVTRCTQFYLTYADADGNTYTVLSGVNQQLAQ